MKNITKGLDDSLLEVHYTEENRHHLVQVDEEEIQKAYNEFYDDVFPEWRRFGNIVQFKVIQLIT